MTRPRSLPCWALLLAAFGGCGGPSADERENRKSLEMLLTAISIRSPKEIEKDAKRIDERHLAGVLSDRSHGRLAQIIGKARSGDWAKAEEMAYAFRQEKPYFK